MGDILLTLRHPSKAALAPTSGSNRLLIDGIPACGSFPPWPSCPDILYESGSRVLCGVTYGVHESDRALVKDLFRSMDHGAVRYREFRAEPTAGGSGPAPALPGSQLADIPWIPQCFPNEDYLEIVWAAAQPDLFGLAQLANHTWFYSPTREVLALRVGDLDEIAKEYGLVVPVRLALPALEFSYLDDE